MFKVMHIWHLTECTIILALFFWLGPIEAFTRTSRTFAVYRSLQLTISPNIPGASVEVSTATELLELYNTEYLLRMKQGRNEGKTPQRVELERAQKLRADGIKQERIQLRMAIEKVNSNATAICLGIMATTGDKALKTLRAWVSELGLPRGIMYAVDENNDSIESTTLDEAPVYIKYNSSDSGNAYMKPYKHDSFVGVIFQPDLGDGLFRQYGDLPLQLF